MILLTYKLYHFHNTKKFTLEIRIIRSNDMIIQIVVLSLITISFSEPCIMKLCQNSVSRSSEYQKLSCPCSPRQNYWNPLVVLVCSSIKSWKNDHKLGSTLGWITIWTISWLSSSTTGCCHERFTTTTLAFRVWIDKNKLRSDNSRKNVLVKKKAMKRRPVINIISHVKGKKGVKASNRIKHNIWTYYTDADILPTK